MDRYIKGRRVAEYYDLNLRFHDLLMSYAGNVRLAQIYRRVIKELHLFRLHGLARGAALEMSNTEHREILEALQAGSVSKASKAMRGHVEAALQRVQMVVQSAAT
jgi:DNA-binding GntR family transcriptional regulator